MFAWTDKIDTITTCRLSPATYKLGIPERALLKQLKQREANSLNCMNSPNSSDSVNSNT